MTSRLNPYLNFDGTARTAIEFYTSVFGGELTVSTFGENGMSDDPAEVDKVMHAQLTTGSGFTLMASDTPPGIPAPSTEGNISISLSGAKADEAELKGYWSKLGEGGMAIMPLATAPWGDQFGMLKDRFGTTWMVNIAGT
ncbi:VOC family protein [Cucumibacter marinus]|uniref:VOC family protein n=1 Tax=Cucumibacter marinus TaxID=1121252 RepID=UPI00048D63F2|nr:VOC family protein [Cucumibacter marinus]